MAIGYLTIQARTAHDAIPLAGVRIGILDDEGRSVYELTTDENGEAPLVSLETVDRELSLDPYYGGKSYIGYDVFAQTAGFHSIHVTEIPIYEGETAVLPLMFVPLSEGLRRRLLMSRACCVRSSFLIRLRCILAARRLMHRMCRYPFRTM